MPLREGAKRLYRAFNQGISYKAGDIGDKLIDAQNLIIVQNKLQTRPGLKKLTSSAFSEAPQSLSFYKKDDGTRKLLAKTGTTMQVADPNDGVFSSIATGLSTSNIHDAVTTGGRHIIALGSDGLYSYDGTNFVALGLAAPTAPVATIAGGGSLTQPNGYTIAITYYESSTGFETNIGTDSNTATSSAGNQEINVTAIPVSTNALVTHKNIYIKKDSGSYFYVDQITNATTTYGPITAFPSSTAANPPDGKDVPLAGGAKYLSIYNSQVVAAGNANFKSDIFFANTDEPDGWSTDNTLVHVNGNGDITGIAVGYYPGSTVLNQYLVGFKRRSLTIYFQSIAGPSEDQQIDIDGVGCVSHKSIKVKDGNIYFLSDYGWRVISGGRLIDGTLGGGDVDDIFRIANFAYGLNKASLDTAFATYYSELDTYMCWVPEGLSSVINKVYAWHMDVKQWMPLLMNRSTCAVTGEDGSGYETVFVGNSDKNIYKYSIRNEYSDDITTKGFTLDISRADIDTIQEDSASSIPVFVYFNWQPNEDFSSSYNFRDLTIESIGDATDELSDLTVKAYLNFSRTTSYEFDYDLFSLEGFTLDVSMLDVDILGDDRSRARVQADINLTARNIMFSLSQDIIDAKLQLLAYQLEFSKNGNQN